ncbi:glutaredoxin [Leucobacter luti]|nr:glutaredoxin [Leucobacter luti]
MNEPVDSTPAGAHNADAAAPQETVMFGADWCGDCRRAKIVLDRAGVEYRYVDLVQDPAAADVAKDISGRTNIPVILFPDRSHQVEPSNADLQRKIDELGLARA